MAYRRQKRRYGSFSRPKKRPARTSAPVATDLLFEFIEWACAGVAGGMRRLWRRMSGPAQADMAAAHRRTQSGAASADPPSVRLPSSRKQPGPATSRPYPAPFPWGKFAPIARPVSAQTSKDQAQAELECLPYRPVALLSKGEQAVWDPLSRAVRGRYRLFCKVRLADVVSVSRTRRDEQRWFQKISGYHVDFLVCDPETTIPLLVVELDDRSHISAKQQGRDEFKDAVLKSAGLPI